MSSTKPQPTIRIFGTDPEFASYSMHEKKPTQLWRHYVREDARIKQIRKRGPREGEGWESFYLGIVQERLNLMRDYYQLMTWVNRLVEPHRVTRADKEILNQIKQIPCVNALFYNQNPPCSEAETIDDSTVLSTMSLQGPALMAKGLKKILLDLKTEWEGWQGEADCEDLADRIGRKLKAFSRDCPGIAEGILRAAKALPEDPPTPVLE